ncbi:hypothetical protein ACHHYP_05548 [Achlya hypogyna]|uniref:DUF4246 domain-containing protein n=1 Tax=Achlya hypogyna TaxID=1202772 RepID=A0A1V9ZNK7_ACHHY|nr:hypothetical protein ACHHYP_05548 [Achlya hypogyna]
MNADYPQEWTLLMRAAHNGDADSVVRLLAYSAANTQTSTGTTALHLAAAAGHVSIVDALLAGGADANIANETGETALMAAAVQSHLDVVRRLHKNFDVDQRDHAGATALIRAVKAKSNVATIKYLVTHGQAKADLLDADGLSALHYASALANVEVMELLLRYVSASINGNHVATTPLLYCVRFPGVTAAIELLLKHARYTSTDRDGKTPLHIACEWGHESNARALIPSSNVAAEDKHGKTPMCYLTASNPGIILALLENENARDLINRRRSGPLLLQQAIESGNTALALALIPHADLSLRYQAQKTLVSLASRHGQDEVVVALRASPRWFWQPSPARRAEVPTVRDVYTLVELAYMHALCGVLSKPQWYVKMTDPVIRAKWQFELQYSDADFAYLMDELAYYADEFHLGRPSSTFIAPSSVHGVFTSDILMGDDKLAVLKQLLAPLEAAAIARGDFHPHSHDQVVDTVHPSMYCAVYGRTRYSRVPGAVVGERVLHSDLEPCTGRDVSLAFQWLPTAVDVDATGSAHFLSYVNNVHPRYTAVLSALEAVLSTMHPLFELALGAMTSTPVHRIVVSGAVEAYPTEEEEEAYKRSIRGPNAELDDDDDDDVDYYGSEFLAFRKARYATAVAAGAATGEPPVFEPHLPQQFSPPPTPRTGVDLRCKLQVITKVASIHLTPEAPRYGGGSWHVEGMANEAIVATGILYYDMANTTASTLRFRQVVAEDIALDYPQNMHQGIAEVFGLVNDEWLVQETGFITALEGRIVVFPNNLQHCVAPFELADPTKPGHRKIVAFFLVDPDRTVLSTSHVPPQQQDWFDATLEPSGLPAEAITFIGAYAGLMTHEQARRYMKQLMEERKESQELANHNIPQVSLCEH